VILKEDSMPDIKTIYVVDDEEKILELIKSYLLKEGYIVRTFKDGFSALKEFETNQPDMFIIDVMMPGMDGYSLCTEIRKKSKIPIIMVSAKDTDIDKVVGLEIGSDDYISKPFSPRELMARVKSLFRRIDDKYYIESTDTAVKYKDLVIKPNERSIYKDNNNLEFTAKEYDFMLYLLNAKNKLVSKAELLKAVWGFSENEDTRVIDDVLKRIRKKLESCGSKVQIVTIWGYGYRISQE